jgi:hypothetical protein
MPRWITVRQKFDYRWPTRAITHFSDADLGDQFVKDEVADFAVEKGYATEGKLSDASRSTKGTGKRRRKKVKAPVTTANSGPDDAVAKPDMADADRAAGGVALDPDAG